MSTSFSTCPRATDQRRPTSPPSFGLSNAPIHPPFLPTTASIFASSAPATSPQPSFRTARPVHPGDHFVPRSQPYSVVEHAMRSYSTAFGHDAACHQLQRPQIVTSEVVSSSYPATLPPPSLPPPSITPSSQVLSLTPQLLPHPLPPPPVQGAAHLRCLSASQQSAGSRPPTASSNMGLSPGDLSAGSRSRRNSSNDAIPSRPPASHSRKSSQLGVRVGGDALENHPGGRAKSKSAVLKEPPATGPSSPQARRKTASSAASAVEMTPAATATPTKSRRVRTGCLTCRERHLKCDESLPDCLNCRKGNRTCKRGLRLNFIDIQTKPIPFVPATLEWKVSFLDESRLIASEYLGGLNRYPPRLQNADPAPPHAMEEDAFRTKRRRPSRQLEGLELGGGPYIAAPAIPVDSMHPSFARNSPDRLQAPEFQQHGYHAPFFSSSAAQSRVHTAHDRITDGHGARDGHGPHVFSHAIKDELGDQMHQYQGSDAESIASSMVPQGDGGPSSVASFQADMGNSPDVLSSGSAARQAGAGNGGLPTEAMLEGLPTPPSEKTGLLRPGGAGVVGGFGDIHGANRSSSNGEREYLNSPDEVLYMQVFVEEVGVWMDSLDKDKHFSRVIPFMALKSPMMLNAFLACGVKHLTLVNAAYKDDKALFYYDTATTQLLRSLQNPDRDIVECATTAVVLNVYEIMSEKPNERMSHIAGARALIRECGWDARSTGIGSACFWLNIGMEVLSCIAFNWPTAWDPDQWGLDTDFTNGVEDSNEESRGRDQNTKGEADQSGSQRAQYAAGRPTTKEPPTFTAAATAGTPSSGDEEVWVHRIFYIVAKIANFRASAPRFQQPSPHDEQVRLQNRFAEWKRLKSLCDIWNRDCPRSMRPFSYLFPSQSPSSASLFPNIWLIRRAAVIGRLFYHTAMVLLHQANPVQPYDSVENVDAQRHHAHQVCGIVAHTKDRGVASVAIRSLANSALVLRDPNEQDEVFSLLKKITAETGWRIDRIYAELQQAWGRDMKDHPSPAVPVSLSPVGILPPPSDLRPAGLLSSSFGPSFNSVASPFRPPATLAVLSPSSSRRPLPGPVSNGPIYRAHHPRMHSSTSVASNTSVSVTATAASSAHSSPYMGAPLPSRPPQMNPLVHADFSLPDHPYKAFYRPPNDSTHVNFSPS